MKKTSLTRALFVAGVMAVAGGVAQADAIFYPDGTHVNLGENAVENGLASSVLAQSSTTAPSSMVALGDDMVNTTSLGAGPAPTRMTTTTVTTTTPVYVFPSINPVPGPVLAQPHRMHARVITNEPVALATVPPPLTVDTTSLGAGPAYMGTTTWYGPVTIDTNNGLSPSGQLRSNNCGTSNPCDYLPG
jgi:hypothetical protein